MESVLETVIKHFARLIQAGSKHSYSECLEIIAHKSGHASWRSLKAKIAQSPDFDRTGLEALAKETGFSSWEALRADMDSLEKGTPLPVRVPPRDCVLSIGRTAFDLASLQVGTLFVGPTVPLTRNVLAPALISVLCHESEFQLGLPGGLILDFDGTLGEAARAAMVKRGTPEDLIVLDSKATIDALDASGPTELATKLSIINRVWGDNMYWDETCKSTILGLAHLFQGNPNISNVLEAMGEAIRSEAVSLPYQAATETTATEIADWAEQVRVNFARMSENTKTSFKSSFHRMFSGLSSPGLLHEPKNRIKEILNDGKVVVIPLHTLDPDSAISAAALLKMRFQKWTLRRNGHQSLEYGLNPRRPVILATQRYDLIASGDGEGDGSYFGISRSARVIALLGIPSMKALQIRIENAQSFMILLSNLCNAVVMHPNRGEELEPETAGYCTSRRGNYVRENQAITMVAQENAPRPPNLSTVACAGEASLNVEVFSYCDRLR